MLSNHCGDWKFILRDFKKYYKQIKTSCNQSQIRDEAFDKPEGLTSSGPSTVLITWASSSAHSPVGLRSVEKWSPGKNEDC